MEHVRLLLQASFPMVLEMSFFGDGVGELQMFWTQNLAFSPFFSSFETGSWEVNHSFESDLCCGDSWLRRSLR